VKKEDGGEVNLSNKHPKGEVKKREKQEDTVRKRVKTVNFPERPLQ